MTMLLRLNIFILAGFLSVGLLADETDVSISASLGKVIVSPQYIAALSLAKANLPRGAERFSLGKILEEKSGPDVRSLRLELRTSQPSRPDMYFGALIASFSENFGGQRELSSVVFEFPKR